MINECIPILEVATLTTYVSAPNDGVARPAVVVLPGGGWIDLSPNEGECVAQAFVAQGFQAFVLEYSTLRSNPEGCAFPQPLRELGETVRLIKQRAADWYVDPASVFVLGFSAGGFICASYGNRWRQTALDLGNDPEMMRVAGTVLCYPGLEPSVLYETMHAQTGMISLDSITGEQAKMRLEAFERMGKRGLFGREDPSQEEVEAVGCTAGICSDTPPAFVWGTYRDGIIDPQQLYRFALRLADEGIPHELHLFEAGTHGLSLGTEQSATKPEGVVEGMQAWLPLSAAWMRQTASS